MQGEQELEEGSKNDEIRLTTPGPSGFRLVSISSSARAEVQKRCASRILQQDTRTEYSEYIGVVVLPGSTPSRYLLIKSSSPSFYSFGIWLHSLVGKLSVKSINQ
jgi:hypothetical protein